MDTDNSDPKDPRENLPISLTDRPDFQWKKYIQSRVEWADFYVGIDPLDNTFHAYCTDVRFVFIKGTAKEIANQIETAIQLYDAYLKEKKNESKHDSDENSSTDLV